jgi:hypothetical protein
MGNEFFSNNFYCFSTKEKNLGTFWKLLFFFAREFNYLLISWKILPNFLYHKTEGKNQYQYKYK